MNRTAPYAALLAFSSASLAACGVLFAEAGTAPVALASRDGGDEADGVAAVVLPSVRRCETPGAKCSALTSRDFDATSLNDPLAVSNVAIASGASGLLYVAVQGWTTGNVGSVLNGATGWDSWPPEMGPPAKPLSSNGKLCTGPSCVGTLHLSVWNAPLATFSGAQCGPGLRDAAQLNAAKTHYCVGSTSPKASTDVYAAVDGTPQAVGAFILAGSGGGRATSTSTSTSTLDVDGAFGLWGNVVNEQFYAVYNNGASLFRADSVGAGTVGVTDKSSITNLGSAVAHPDVAVDGNTAYIAGVVPDKDMSSFTLVARNWSDGTDVAQMFPSLATLGFAKRFVPRPYVPSGTATSGDNPARGLFKPLLVRVRASDTTLRLVGLNALDLLGSNKCELRVAVQKSKLLWETRVLDTFTDCQKVSFDAALDATGKLHVLYGQATGTVGYKVLAP